MSGSSTRSAGEPNHSGWRFGRAGQLCWLSCDLLDRVPGVVHAFSTRCAGPSEGGSNGFDLGSAGDDDPAVLERRRRLCAALGLGRQPVVTLQQVHGSRVVPLASARDEGEVRADGIFALRRDAARGLPAVRSADCVPLLLAEQDGRAVAAVHSGWRGTAAGIAGRVVARLGRAGVAPGRLRAALGPAIGPCCYEVGPEVVEQVSRASGLAAQTLTRERGGGKVSIDLARALRAQLVSSGLDEPAVSIAPWCTACRADLFFSYRREGAAAGRMMALIGWSSASGPPDRRPSA